MGTESKAKYRLIAVVVWLVILTGVGAAYKYFLHPMLKGKIAGVTGSKSQYKQEIKIAADSFSGYAILRSPVMAEQLKQKGIKLTIIDDKADYGARLKSCIDGKTHMSVFTIDSLITAGAKVKVGIEELPTIVSLIDESNKADAIVAYKSAIANVQELNNPDVRFVLTPNSPSEFLPRIVLAHFNILSLPEKWWIEANGSADVYKMFKSADRSAKRAYAMWEPYVSMALQDPDAIVLVDSSKLRGYIFDVFCAHRKFLKEQPELVKEVVEDYLRAAYYYTQDEKRLVQLVIDDAKKTGSEHLTEENAKNIINGIRWKNTLENYAHFSLVKGREKGLQNLEDIITNIADVLVKTGAIKPEQDPVQGKAAMLFYDKTLASLQQENFHPGQKLSLINDLNIGAELEDIRVNGELPALSDEQWSRLVSVGQLRVKPISFLRGTSKISIQSSRDLDELVAHLKSWAQYYLIVTGHARQEGDDAELNLELARERAEAAVAYLVSKGVTENKIKTKAELIAGGGEAQSVSFVVGQLPY